MTPFEILALPEDTFWRLVAAELKNEAPPIVGELLRSPEVAARWHDTLTGIVQDVDSQLTMREADFRTLPKLAYDEYCHETRTYKGWRAGAIRFRLKALERKREAKRCQSVDWCRTARELAEAIAAHRLASEGAGLDPEDHDRALWAHADEAATRYRWWLIRERSDALS